MTLKGYLDHQKATLSGPDQASMCDELGERVAIFPQGQRKHTNLQFCHLSGTRPGQDFYIA